WSTVEVKSAEDRGGKRTFSGVASTPTTDRMGDIVEPKGAQFKLPLALLWQHDASQPIGWVKSARVTDNGIEVQAEMASVDEPGKLKDRLDEAWQSLKSGLVRGLSIGFRAIEAQDIKGTWGQRFTKWDWLELSAVTIPANAEANILAIKSSDAAQLAATGRTSRSVQTPPGASGTKQAASGRFFNAQRKEDEVKTLQELIDARAQAAARMNELTELKTAEARRFTAEEGAEFDQLLDDIGSLDDDIRTAKAQALSASTARAVDGLSQRGASQSRGRSPNIIVRNTDPEDKFKGQSFVRGVIAKALAQMHGASAIEIAQHRWGKTHPQLVQWIKADVAGGGAGSGEWGAELVQADGRFTGDFIEYLYGMTIFDRLPLRSVPANVTIKGQDGAATGYWVGESKGIPMSKADFSNVSLTPLKVAALTVLSNELIRDSSPSAEMLVRDALAEASAQKVDTTFLSTSAASSGVSPAGILNGLTANTSEGITADDARDDLNGLYNYFAGQKNTSGLVIVTTPVIANALYNLRNALGQMEFPGMTRTGGELQGFPVYVGDNVGTGDLIMMKPSDIWKIGDGGVQVSISREAAIEQSDAPTGATDTPATAGNSTKWTSMFQEESTAIKVVRSINFQKRRSTAVAYIGNAAYGDPASV
ncbi:MAG TPA: phage major capsid protein, partial [Burkholderiaceae bacterium]|nr:phage major capsid protein [Burkholderiaceae bacterium]